MTVQYYTYIHCKPNDDPFYVGKGTLERAKRLTNRNNHHAGIVKKYGKKNIKVYYFECDSEEQAFSDEIQWIANLTNEGFDLANHTSGGEGCSGHKHSEETKALLSKKNKGRVLGPRGPLSEEHRKKVSIATKLALSDPAVREKISKAGMGNKSFLGKKLTEEHKQHIKEATKEALSNPETRAKMSSSHTGKKRGPMSEEQKLKLSIAHTGKKLSPEHCANIGKAGLGRKMPPFSDEHKRKISEAAKLQQRKKKKTNSWQTLK